MRPAFSESASAPPRCSSRAVIASLALLVMPAVALSQSVGNGGGPAGTSGNAPGNPAATAGPPAADPVFQPLTNPLNRNPARQTVTLPDITPAADDSNSSSRPTQGAVTTPDSRDTLVAPDPSRDSTTNPVANPPP